MHYDLLPPPRPLLNYHGDLYRACLYMHYDFTSPPLLDYHGDLYRACLYMHYDFHFSPPPSWIIMEICVLPSNIYYYHGDLISPFSLINVDYHEDLYNTKHGQLLVYAQV